MQLYTIYDKYENMIVSEDQGTPYHPKLGGIGRIISYTDSVLACGMGGVSTLDMPN